MKTRINKILKNARYSIWTFPAILTVILVLLTVFQISGSSIGVYHKYFYGESKPDINLVFGTPRPIRGDEWNSTTQIRIGQEKNGYERINYNIGNGHDLSILDYGAYKDWSVIFKPQTLAFFILPFDNAFAFQWWFMLYLLMLSVYFFTLRFLPKRILSAVLIAIGFSFSPFIQWWYLYGTLGSIYYSLFAAIIFMKILDSRQETHRLLYGGVLVYILACFALVLYPPFQIPSALVVSFFSLGYLLEKSQYTSRKKLLRPLAITIGAIIIALLIVCTYITTRAAAINAMIQTEYPGARVVPSGGYNAFHLLSGQFDRQLLNPKRADHYPIGGNQSEASNFILLIPAMFAPGILLLVRQFKKKRSIDWPLTITSFAFLLLLCRLFIPYTDILFKPLMLGSIPHSRILIGIGLLSVIHTVLIIRSIERLKEGIAEKKWILVYITIVTIFYLLLGLYTAQTCPGFIGTPKAMLFSLVIPFVAYLILRKKIALGLLLYCVFSLYSAAAVNPLYKSVTSITDSELSKTIQELAAKDKGRWATESIVYEHFPVMNGARALTGVYSYPQLSLWSDSGSPESTYNRYAHIRVLIDRDANKTIPSHLALASPDTIDILTEPCSNFLKRREVRFILTEVPIPDTCVTLERTITYPYRIFYIYRISQYLG